MSTGAKHRSTEQRERASGSLSVPELRETCISMRIFHRRYCAVSHSFPVQVGVAVDVPGVVVYCRAARNRLLASRCFIQCCAASDPRILEYSLVASFSGAGKATVFPDGLPRGRRTFFRGYWSYLLYLRASNREPPSFNLFAARRIVGDEPAPKRWAIKHRADSAP